MTFVGRRMTADSIGGSKYFIGFIDDYTRCCSVYFPQEYKSDNFKEYEARVFNDCGLRIGTMRSDNGGEYL